MTSFLMLNEIVSTSKFPGMPFAGPDWATISLGAVNLAFVSVNIAFYAEWPVVAGRLLTDEGFAVLALVSPETVWYV